MNVPMYPDIFNDVYGPVMQPKSSSHTAGPVRVGFISGCLVDQEKVKKIIIQIDPKSTFVSSLNLQRIDLALLSGATGHQADDKVLFDMKQYCLDRGIETEFVFEPMRESTHHSAAKVTIITKDGKEVYSVSKSLGAGMIETDVVNGYPFHTVGDTYSLLVVDEKETVDLPALDSALRERYTVLDSGVSTAEGKGRMLWFKIPEEVTVSAVADLTNSENTYVIRPCQVVITRPDRKPQLFNTFKEWKALAEAQGKTLDEVVIDYEVASSGWSREEVIAYFRDVIQAVMHRETHCLFEEDIPLPTGRYAPKDVGLWKNYAEKGLGALSETMYKSALYSACVQTWTPGVKLVPGPMGAGGGLIYSSLSAVAETKGFSKEQILKGVIVAGGLGAIVFSHCQPGGVSMGCAGEQGICMAMASAGIVAMAGGTPDQVESAASRALQISVGWPCDPIPGACGQPCVSRALTGVIMAQVFAEQSLLGFNAVFPFDEEIVLAYELGKAMPEEQRGDSQGAHGSLPTAKACIKAFNEWCESRK